ncbi:MAG TPA: CRISPR-associated protein [Candidatus Atribacteria bacterium]|nr:CRISPR-associated protein [Candidatus Atribacteria bacterium]
MNLDFLDDYKDPYLKTNQGKGVFLAGVLFGYMAKCQNDEIKKAPIFKQLDFGRMNMRSLKKQLSRVPQLIYAYEGVSKYSGFFTKLAAKAGELLFSDGQKDLGVDGNFAFTVGFSNGAEFFWKIFKKIELNENMSEEGN